MTRTRTITKTKQNIYRNAKWIETYINNIRKKISQENFELLTRYNDDMIVSSLSLITRNKNLNHFGLLTRMLGKNWKDATENDYRSLAAKIMTNHGDNGKETTYSGALKMSLRFIARFTKTGSRKIPDSGEIQELKFLTIRTPDDTITREDLPTDEEVAKLIAACADSSRDKAMFAVHAEAGTRIGELLGLKIKDVTIDKYGATIKVDGKTGVRPIRIVTSVPYLTKWMNDHPFKNDGEHELWIYIQAKDSYGQPINYAGFNAILRKRLAHAGITKRITSHLFRHREITNLASNLTETESRMRHGWKKSSNMPSRYTHLNQQDLDNKILKIMGVVKEDDTNKMTLRKCVYCNIPHPIESKFCEVCTRPLDVTEALRMEKEQEEKTQAMIDERLRQNHSMKHLYDKSEQLELQNQKQLQEIEELKQIVKRLSQP